LSQSCWWTNRISITIANGRITIFLSVLLTLRVQWGSGDCQVIKKTLIVIFFAAIWVLFLAPSRLAAWENECPATQERLKKGEIVQEHTRCPRGVAGIKSRF